MVLFILFPGNGISKKHWEIYDESGKIKKTSFLEQLKKLGKVYKYTPNVNNIIHYYNNSWKLRKKFYKKPSNLTLEDFDIDKQCKLVYEDVKNYKGKFIPVGHSIGGYYAIQFSKLYKSRCAKTILIDSVVIAPKYVKEWDKMLYKPIKKYGNITNEYLHSLFYDIQNSKETKILNKNVMKLVNIRFFLENKQFKKFNGKLVVPNLSIRSLYIDIKKNKLDKLTKRVIDNEEILYKKNGDKSQAYYLIDATHFPWFIPRYCDEIIDQIKCFI